MGWDVRRSPISKIKICEICQKKFLTVSSKAKTCSGLCNTKRWTKNNPEKALQQRLKAQSKRKSEGKHSKYKPEQRRIWYKNRVLKDPEYKKRLNIQAKTRNKSIKHFLADYKLQKGCHDCGYKKHHAALDFDHVKGSKMLNVCFAKSIGQAKKEIEKCEVVCSNCHRIRTYNRIYPCKPDIFEMTYEMVQDERLSLNS